MSTATTSARAAPATAPRRRKGHDLRLILSAAGFTSLFWIALFAFVGPGFFAPDLPVEQDPAPDAFEAGEDVAAPTIEQALPANAQIVPAGALRVPVAGVRPEDLIDTYDDPRGSDRVHEAIDILAPTGTPVIAAAEGSVEKLFLSDAGGKTIYVRSTDGERMYYYAHLDAYAPGLEEGAFVKSGDRLGTVGASGNADPSTPHLHFAVLSMTPDEPWWKGAPENPYPLLTATN